MFCKLVVGMSILCTCISLSVHAQELHNLDSAKILMRQQPTSIFIFTRGTRRKSALIGKQYNYVDVQSTHVGIGYIDQQKEYIYHVTDERQEGSALRKETLKEFYGAADVYYGSIWKLDATEAQVKKLKDICQMYLARKIYFDSNFLLASNDTLYCAEFCVQVLEQLNVFYPARKLAINNLLYERILNRKTLIYYPVDFFITDKRFVPLITCITKPKNEMP